MSEHELKGRVALVTGAARNIGRAIARELAAAGAAVVVNARNSKAALGTVAAEIVADGGQALAVLADITDRTAVDSMVAAARATFGRLDILVNNAAVRGEADLDEIDHGEWRRVLDVILDGAFFCVQACLADLRASDAGRIINIGGLTAHAGAARRLHVITAKAGLAGFTRALAHDLGAAGITVNCVSPGMIDTQRPESAGTNEHRRHRQTLVPGLGMPEDVARMVRHLAGPAGRYITGQTIHVNGGTYLG